jgi:hypothetical protein
MNERSLSVNLSALAMFAACTYSLALLTMPEVVPSKVSLSETAMESVNRRNRLVKNVFCPSIKTGLLIKSSIFYEKPDRMLFLSASAWRDEALIGCDGKKYWFWMRSFDDNSLYFCDLEKLDSTRLMPLMRPEVVSCIAWVDEIKGEPVPVGGPRFKAEHTRGRLRKLVEFDSEKVVRQEIFVDGKSVVSLRAVEFGRFSGVLLPTKVEAEWPDEGLSGTFSIEGWKVNADAPEISEPKKMRRVDLEGL